MNSAEIETSISQSPETSEILNLKTVSSSTLKSNHLLSRDSIRPSLKASTLDGFFSTVFGMTTGGILLSNFLVELGASPVVFGIMFAIPMVVNLIQPLGAYLSEQRTSRFWYSVWTYGTSRILWLILVIGIATSLLGVLNYNHLVLLTLLILLLSHLLYALGYASWLSWLARIVPRKIRGRYFGFRNSVVCLTNLLCIPLMGFTVSIWPGGNLQGYGLVLCAGIMAGIASLACQNFQKDVNPKLENTLLMKSLEKVELQPQDKPLSKQSSTFALEEIQDPTATSPASAPLILTQDSPQQNITSNKPSIEEKSIWRNSNGFMFLIYFGVWMFSVHLSMPFFDLYMLDNLNLDVSLVTVYGSVKAGANLVMLILWGKLADKIGNNYTLVLAGIFMIIIPLLWIGIGNDVIDVWLWLPLLHIFIGAIWAALDLCHNNLQIGVAPMQKQSLYFSLVAAVGGVSGAMGTMGGGFLAQNPSSGGILGLFAISSVFRLLCLIPLIFVQEPPRPSFVQKIQSLWTFRAKEGRC